MAHLDWTPIIKSFGIREVVDAGANLGGWIPLWFDCGATRVIAIEPVPDCFAKLITKHGEDPRVHALRLGVSDAPGQLSKLNVHNCWTLLPEGTKKLARALEYVDVPSFDVTFDTIDAICEREKIRPNFLKIDVDGYDVRALRGARDVLKRRPLIMLEVSCLPKNALGDDYPALLEEMISMGYRIQHFLTGEIFTKLKDFMPVFPWHTSFDVFLLPP